MASQQLKRDASAAAQEVIDRHVHEGKETGIQVVAYLDGEKIVDVWSGVAEAGTDRNIDGNTLFNVFSVSKAICDVALWIQVDVPLGAGGIWLSAPFQPALPGRGRRVLIKPGYGHSIGWADVDNRFAVGICHNQLYNPHTPEQCRMTPIGDAIRNVLGIRYATRSAHNGGVS